MRPTSLQTFALVIGLGAVACSGEDAGGAPGSGGNAPGKGGSVATGGSSPSGFGGSPAPGAAGNQSVGGSGGSASGTGGTNGGGECTNVRPTGTEWDEATCDQWASETSECGNAWMIEGNYCNESCGRCSSNGTGGTGSGTAGSGSGGTNGGGAGTDGGGNAGAANACTEPNKRVCNNETNNHCGYVYEYWKDSGEGCQVNTADGFSVDWSNINNLLGRKGLRPGSKNQIVTYDADYQPNGNSYLCVYGWTKGPLIEYYIVDSWGNWRPPGNQPRLGQVTTDGGTYDIYRTERVNQPSIEGTKTFYQYWSVRTQKRESGTITVGNHFAAWEGLGLNLGSLYEVSMTVEGYQSSGTATVRVSMR